MLERLKIKIMHGMVGILYAWRNEKSFRIQVICSSIVVFFNILLNVNSSIWNHSMILIFGILSLELINTAIEKLCDYVQPDKDFYIKLIKDFSAGAVLILCIYAFWYAFYTYIPLIIYFIQGI